MLPWLFRPNAELFRWFGALLREFSEHTAAALTAGPFVPTLERFERKWLVVGINLLNNGFPNEANEIFLGWYQFVRNQEIARTVRFPKGTALWWLGQSSRALRLNDEAKSRPN